MRANDLSEFITGFNGLCQYWSRKNSEQLTMLYWKAMQDLTIDEFKSACVLAIQTLKFFPKVSELRELVHGTRNDQALAAWERVLEAHQVAGPYDSVCFEDPRIARAIEFMGGWIASCNWLENEIAFRRQEFIKAYQGLAATNTRHMLEPVTLHGIVATHNLAAGHSECGPIVHYIGNRRAYRMSITEG